PLRPFSPFAQNRQRYRAKPLFKAARAGGSNQRKSGGSNFRKSGGPHPRKSGGSNQRKFCTQLATWPACPVRKRTIREEEGEFGGGRPGGACGDRVVTL